MSYTFTTEEMEERHTALNISEKLENVFSKWKIKDKVTTIITQITTHYYTTIIT